MNELGFSKAFLDSNASVNLVFLEEKKFAHLFAVFFLKGISFVI